MNRDTAERREITDLIFEIACLRPHWRVGQVIANAVRAATGQINCDPFHMSDQQMLAGLRGLYGQLIKDDAK